MVSAGQWEVVSKPKKSTKPSGSPSKQNGKSKQEKSDLFLVNAPKLEELVAMGSGETRFSALDPEAKRKAKEAEKAKANGAAKALAAAEAKKKNDKKAAEKKPEGPKNFDEALKELKLSEITQVVDTVRARFSNSPMLWLKDLVSHLNLNLNFPTDPTFADKGPEYPASNLPTDVRQFLVKFLSGLEDSKSEDSVLAIFCEQSVLAVIQDAGKGLPVNGYKDVKSAATIFEPKYFLRILDLAYPVPNGLTLPAPIHKELLAIFPRMKAIFITGHPEKTLHTVFVELLERVEQNSDDARQKEVLSLLIQGLKEDPNTYAAWSQCFPSHIPGSAVLLGKLVSQKACLPALRPTLVEMLGAAQRSVNHGKVSDQAKQSVSHIQFLLSNMSIDRGQSWAFVNTLLVCALAGLMWYDIQVHGNGRFSEGKLGRAVEKYGGAIRSSEAYRYVAEYTRDLPNQSRNASLLYMHKQGPHMKTRTRRKPLDGQPFMKGVVLKTLIKKPKKPNSANRKSVLVRLTNGKELVAYVPGEGHNLQEHNIVLTRVGRLQDVPGVKIRCVRGKYDLPHVIKKK
nr:EOG090X0NTZ [Lepidurus arcticus]